MGCTQPKSKKPTAPIPSQIKSQPTSVLPQEEAQIPKISAEEYIDILFRAEKKRNQLRKSLE